MRIMKRVLIGYAFVAVSSVIAALIVRRMVPEFGDESDDVVSLVAAMGGRSFASRSDALRSVEAVACMGGIEIDLTHAQIVDGARLRLHAVMGGIQVTVPSGWRVNVVSRSVMGGVGNGLARSTDTDAPLVVVEASAIMGGIDIRPGDDA
jgi:hypothetical protein